MDDVTPPKKLALTYTPAEFRAAFGWLLSLDERLKTAILGASEPMIAQIKLAWWREAVGRDRGSRPKGEPLLQVLEAISDGDVKYDVIQPGMALIDAWDMFATSLTDAERASALAARGEALFSTYANWAATSAGNRATELGRTWAIFDMGLESEPASIDGKAPRPLTILYHAAQLQAAPSRPLDGLRLLWHALTGR